jgi:hypothetical protein
MVHKILDACGRNNPNQAHHTFHHVKEAGMNEKEAVIKAISALH